MSASPPPRPNPIAIAAAFLLPPFLFLGWILWSPHTLGNDYPTFQVLEPAFLRFMTAQDLEPMWYPHMTGGIPIGGLFFAQYFHAPAWITSHLPGFWSGDALRLVSVRHLLLLAAGHALFYASFRRAIGLGIWRSYLLSFACVYHLRNLDALRYGAGIEGTLYAQAVVLLALLHVLGPSRASLAVLVAVSQLLLTCGYPVAIPFVALAALLSVPILGAVVGVRSLLVRGLQALGAALVGFLLAAPNWMALAEWLAVNESRVHRPTIEWAADMAITAGGLFDNLFLPWRADVHSAFGGSLLVLVLLMVAVALVRRARTSWWVLLILAFPFVYALGRATPLFPFFFAHVPGFASLRVPGRGFVMLPVLLVLALLWLRVKAPGESLITELRIAGVAGLLVCLGVIARLVLGGPLENPPEYSPELLGTFWTRGHQLLWLTAGLFLALAALWAHSSRIALGVLVVASAVQTGMLFRHGTWTAQRPDSPSFEDLQRVSHLPLYGRPPILVSNDLDEQNAATATSSYSRFMRSADDMADCFLPVQPSPRLKGMLLPFYLSDRVECVADRDVALRRLHEGCGPRLPAGTVVLEQPCRSYGAPQEPLASRLLKLNERSRIVALTPNLVALEVDTPVAAVLVTAFPDATHNWSGVLDGEPAPLMRVDGGLLGLHVPGGRHRVGIRYFSQRIVLGYRIAFATLLAVVAAGLFRLAGAWASQGLARAALCLGLLTAAVASCLPVYCRWERGFRANARREVTLSNEYAAILARQVARWQRGLPGTPPR